MHPLREQLQNCPDRGELNHQYKWQNRTRTHSVKQIRKQKNKKLEHKNFIIPHDCIVARINPRYIKKIEPWKISLGFNFATLPKIILKDDLKEVQVKREADKSLLRSLDLLPFHEKITQENKKIPENITLSMIR